MLSTAGIRRRLRGDLAPHDFNPGVFHARESPRVKCRVTRKRWAAQGLASPVQASASQRGGSVRAGPIEETELKPVGGAGLLPTEHPVDAHAFDLLVEAG